MIDAQRTTVRAAAEGVRAAIADGGRFVAAFSDQEDDLRQIRYVISRKTGLVVLLGVVGNDPVPALSADIPAADSAEREIRDRFGVEFSGIPEARRLLPPGDPGRTGAASRRRFRRCSTAPCGQGSSSLLGG